MNKQDIFDAWAPAASIWSPWVKPVLFSQLDTLAVDSPQQPQTMFDLDWVKDLGQEFALVIDLPGAKVVQWAISLASLGYRGVPLFNSCPAPDGQSALIDVRSIMTALLNAAPALLTAQLRPDAQPAFLLDANRNTGIASPGQFDNRSISLPTDFPSANFLLSHGIQQIVLVHDNAEPQADLSHTLRRWQDAGMAIFVHSIDGLVAPRPIAITKPKRYRLLWYNFLAKLGLKQHPLGGFGGQLSMPSSG